MGCSQKKALSCDPWEKKVIFFTPVSMAGDKTLEEKRLKNETSSLSLLRSAHPSNQDLNHRFHTLLFLALTICFQHFWKVSTEPNSSSSSRTYSLTYFLPWKNRHIFPSTCFDTELTSSSDGVTVMSQRHQLTLLKEESSVLKHVKVKLHVSLNIRILKNTLNLSWQRESRRTKIYFRFSATRLSLSLLLVPRGNNYNRPGLNLKLLP